MFLTSTRTVSVSLFGGGEFVQVIKRTTIYKDNQDAMFMAPNLVSIKRSQHIATRKQNNNKHHPACLDPHPAVAPTPHLMRSFLEGRVKESPLRRSPRPDPFSWSRSTALSWNMR